jgi:hypothetical protein
LSKPSSSFKQITTRSLAGEMQQCCYTAFASLWAAICCWSCAFTCFSSCVVRCLCMPTALRCQFGLALHDD